MPDEVAADHSAQNAPTPEAPIIVTDWAAVPKMIADLQSIHDMKAPRQRKQVLTVIVLLQLVVLGGGGDPRSAKQVLDLLPSAKIYRDLIRGMVAAAVAWLRAAGINDVKELAALPKTNQPPFVMGFEATEARRWFYNVTETLDGKGNYAPPSTIDVFTLLRPDPSLSPTQDEAKRSALDLLRTVHLVNPAPLA